MRSVVNGLLAASLPCALMLLAHYTLHPTEPPLLDAVTFILQWAIIGVVAHTSRFGLHVFWSALFWSMVIGLLGATWGSYFGRNVYLTLLLPQAVCGLVMAPVSSWLERRAAHV